MRSMALGIMAAVLCFCEMFHPTDGGAREAPAARLADIAARGELRACIWPDYYAISWRNPRSDVLEGLDVELAEALARRLQVRLRFVETTISGFADRLEKGDCDIATMAVGITPERARRVAFTRPYLASPVYAVALRDVARVRQWSDLDRPGIVIAVTTGSIAATVMGATLRQAELLPVRPPQRREQELLSGRADALIGDFAFTRRMLETQDWARVIAPPERFGETFYAHAVRPGDAAWLAEVNAFLAEARADGTMARAAARHGLTPILLP
jgi:ABC-type amino acid transport substrate-binding protein